MTTAPSLTESSTAPQTRQMDLGRLFGVPVMSGLLILNCLALGRSGGRGQLAAGVLSLSGTVLSVLFYLLLIGSFLRRTPAVATTRSPVAVSAAFVASYLSFVIALVPRGRPGAVALMVADVLVISGLALSVWSISRLHRSFSMIAQARTVVRSGPYRLVRHPLYAGELVAVLGIAVMTWSLAAMAIWAVLCGLQAYRAQHEEKVLLAALPDYAEYRSTTGRLIPRVRVR